jgi:hypothetical protein
VLVQAKLLYEIFDILDRQVAELLKKLMNKRGRPP